MILRVTFFALMALGLLGLGFIGYAATRPPPEAMASTRPAPPPVVIRELIVAHEVPAGNLLKREDFTSKDVPVAGTDAILDTDEERRSLIGAMLRRGMTTGELIHRNDVLRPGDHGFLAAALSADMRAVTVAVDAVSDTNGLIRPGDRVDVILTQSISDPAVPLGHRIVAETVAADIRVIAIDQRMVETTAPSATATDARTVTLEVKNTDAQSLQVAVRLGRLSLSVRPADGKSAHTAPETTFASDVSHAFAPGNAAPSTTNQTIKVWSSTGEGKDFKF
jgi:pilus assembly protein CpaB